ncbi:MAG: hypothetical protein M3Q71_09835 [Chloroflexota bacterium]|nr:hypothetical protein [Chloroflexota bacterium]
MGWQGWSLLVAIVALVQPWVLALWRRFFRRGDVRVYETRFGNIEVGYTANGATLGLLFTARAVHREQFIRDISVTVIKERDKSHHHFEWRFFRALTLSLYQPYQETMELPASFLLSPAQPRTLRIVFGDVDLEPEIRVIAERVRALWEEYRPSIEADELDEQGRPFLVPLPPDDSAFLARATASLEQMTKTASYREVLMELDRRCYWEPGRYTMMVKVATTEPKTTHTTSFGFTLTERDSQNLRSNGGMIVRYMVGLPLPGPYLLAFPPYKSDDIEAASR